MMGPNAVDSVMQWGNYEGVPSHTYTILEGIRCKIGDVPLRKDVSYWIIGFLNLILMRSPTMGVPV